MGPYYIATERFGRSAGEKWENYVRWSGLSQLIEVVSLDAMLCPRVVRDVLDEDWPHIVHQDFMGDYFTDLDYLLRRIGPCRPRNVLGVFKNPQIEPLSPGTGSWKFVGYDLVETEGATSALTNCGGFPLAFHNQELNEAGLLGSLPRVKEVQLALRNAYPQEAHAVCDVWGIFRAVEA
jgi:hypothetical protein